ncbi:MULTISPECIES: tripartite tricarboxylate transporter substrate binding protein [unclassified Polaromonas]|uniref:Bug family tripartite tricarboxylate transporter substrate binding protein n=1 Tax=unclassified Polaromonas TaxID=2638319 RepID=UPI0018CA7E3C|nr:MULTISPECIES: tripartite tricarboxylate transporter substrate binding protein [unclassified Polaromonas]MBG6073775.1 tripartite-type tricarboxylate transporter receptor subunit TctC [Polaromonas sp. CG_9.7]MBG6115781.1 tripartite-type tricarboxylate transporter receptor subunit TctC [Polaromonas sp. CG_9.2]MDH6186678.1 tripartite-type tricarboxylate transporter receptor subunit TctC [Polaromonas sp. CG_23.6]
MFSRTRRILTIAALYGFAQLASAAWPENTITLIVPWAAGGSTDILARSLSEQLSKSLGQPVIVDNRAGASGNIGSNVVAKAKPDGYTLLVGSMSTHAMNPALMPNMPFRGVDDFTPIAQIANVVNTLVINPLVPVKNVRELITYAKANPGKLAYASAGAGSTNHLSAVLFEKAAGIEMLHVPYKGGAPAVLDTVGGQTQLLFSAGTQTLPHVKAGKLRLLGVTEAKRSALLTDVPTVGETLPGYELGVWYGVFGPAGMPKDLVVKLNTEINKALSNPDIRARMDAIGVEIVRGTPQEFAIVLRRDADRYDKIIRELGIKND